MLCILAAHRTVFFLDNGEEFYLLAALKVVLWPESTFTKQESAKLPEGPSLVVWSPLEG